MKNSDAFFSVITPVRNAELFISDYIACLQSQTFMRWEAIIIDDFSTDDTYNILLKYSALDPRIKVYKNRIEYSSVSGPSGARNYGLSIVSGVFVCFLDIDDLWFPTKLATNYAVLTNDPRIKLLYSGYIRSTHSFSRSYRKIFLNIPTKIQLQLWNPIPMLTACVCKDIAVSHSFFNLGHEDYLYWHEIAQGLTACQVFFDPSILGIYRISNSSLSGNKVKVIPWWIKCYSHFGYGYPVIGLLLLLRAVMVSIEYATSRFCRVNVTWPPQVNLM